MERKYLGLPGTNKIPEEYDEYWWISERCTDEIKRCKELDKECHLIGRNWNNSEEIQNTIFYLKSVKNNLMESVKVLLNDFHSVSFSTEEWKILVGQWMNYYLESIYDVYLKIKKIEDMEDEFDCYVFDISKEEYPTDFAEYIDLISKSVEYRKYIFSIVIYNTKIPKNINIIPEGKYVKPNINTRFTFKRTLKVRLYRKILFALKGIFGKQDKVIFRNCYFPQKFLFKIMLKSGGTACDYINNWYTLERPLLKKEINYSWRSTQYKDRKEYDEFTNLAFRLLRKFIPITYVEDFDFLKSKVFSEYRFARKPNAVFYSCVEGHVDEIFKIYLMYMKKNGVKLCDLQHGGNYGIDKMWSSDDEYENCDIFYSWGWKADFEFGNKIKPMPAAKLMNKKLRKCESGDKILYLNYIYSKYTMDLSLRAVFYDLSMEKEIDFFSKLKDEIKNKMIIRLYPDDYGWGLKDRLDEKVSGLTFDHYQKFYDSLNQASLVVLADWSTTILEALSVNKPILVLRNMETEKFAESDIKELVRVGIVVNSWEELFAQINAIHNCIWQWWNDAERQKIIKKIQHKYAYLPQDSEKLWEREIMMHVNRGGTYAQQ